MNIARYSMALAIGFAITATLFLLMQLLVATGENAIVDKIVAFKSDAPETQVTRQVVMKEAVVRKPSEPALPPDSQTSPQVKMMRPASGSVSIAGDVPVSTSITPNNAGIGVGLPTEGDFLPTVRVQPIYPRRAQERGIEGYVIVALTVTPQGTTRDIRVIEADPVNIFDGAAIRAAEQFRYKPKIIAGKSVAVSDVLYKFSFTLER